MADALIFIDRAGVIRAWNAGAEALFGFAAVQTLGQSVDMIIPAAPARGALARL